MDDPRTRLLRSLLADQQTGALATLHGGRPAVSMVPFAISPSSHSLVIHVSRLATHTQDMDRSPAVGVLVVADPDPATLPQARARISIVGNALRCDVDAQEYAVARESYLSRFPNSEPMFGFADFSLFLIEPESVRGLAGFAQAWSLTRNQYLQAWSGSA